MCALNLRMNSGSSLKYSKNWCQAENFPRLSQRALKFQSIELITKIPRGNELHNKGQIN